MKVDLPDPLSPKIPITCDFLNSKLGISNLKFEVSYLKITSRISILSKFVILFFSIFFGNDNFLFNELFTLFNAD